MVGRLERVEEGPKKDYSYSHWGSGDPMFSALPVLLFDFTFCILVRVGVVSFGSPL